MSSSATSLLNSGAPQRPFSPLAGLLSYLIPGLGQIYQGRLGKGLLFLLSLYGLFFYGMYLGDFKNVYLAETDPREKGNLPDVLVGVYNRPQFVGQFWVGVAAWPAIWQYNHLPTPSATDHPFWHNFERNPPEKREDAPADWYGKTLNELQTEGDKTWDLGWVFTVVAGVLNILVMYDAAAGPALGSGKVVDDVPRPEPVSA